MIKMTNNLAHFFFQEPYIGGFPKPEFPWVPEAPWKASQSVPVPPSSGAARLARHIVHNAGMKAS